MAIEIIFILAFIIFCLNSKPKNILIFMFLLLPLHGFIKFAFFHASGEIFSTWKEIGILAVFLKTINNKNDRLRYIVFSYLVLVIYYGLFFYIGYTSGYSVLSDVRQFIFPTLLLLSVARMNPSSKDVENILFAIAIGSMLINITGVIDFFSPYLRLAMRTLMGTEFQIDSSGNVYYNVNSFKIMGLDRVAGLMGGGPNMMGVFNAAIIICMLMGLRLKIRYGKIRKVLVLISTGLSAFCLIFSFSRAGWALVALTIFVILLNEKKYRKAAIQYVFLIVMLSVIVYFISDTFRTVIDGTLSGNEASSASRSSMVRNSLTLLLDDPLGQGMGAANHDVKNYYAFAESTLVNLGFCAGIIGIIIYLLHLLTVYQADVRNKRNNVVAIYSSAFVVAYTIAACVSVNVVQNPFVYYAWFIMGLGISKINKDRQVC